MCSMWLVRCLHKYSHFLSTLHFFACFSVAKAGALLSGATIFRIRHGNGALACFLAIYSFILRAQNTFSQSQQSRV